MLLAWLVLLPAVPDLDKLGSEDWRVREVEHRRIDNPLAALLLPPAHDNPEVDWRAKAIRRKHLRHLWDAEYAERWIRHHDYERWLSLYVLGDRPSVFSDYEVFYELHRNPDLAAIYFKLAPHCELPHGGNLYGIPIWLWSSILDGEYETYLLHRDSYRRKR